MVANKPPPFGDIFVKDLNHQENLEDIASENNPEDPVLNALNKELQREADFRNKYPPPPESEETEPPKDTRDINFREGPEGEASRVAAEKAGQLTTANTSTVHPKGSPRPGEEKEKEKRDNTTTFLAQITLSASMQRYLDETFDDLNTMFDNPQNYETQEEMLREYERMREEGIRKLMQENGWDREKSSEVWDQKSEESGAKQKYEDIKQAVEARKDLAIKIDAALEKKQVVDGALPLKDQLAQDQKLLEEIGSTIEELGAYGQHQQWADMQTQQQRIVNVMEFLVELDNKSPNLKVADMNVIQITARMPSNLIDDYIAYHGGPEAYFQELEKAGLSKEDIAYRQGAQAEVAAIKQEIQEQIDAFEERGLTKASTLEGWDNATMGESPTGDYYVFEREDSFLGSIYALQPTDWKDNLMDVLVSKDTHPDLYAEISAKKESGEIALGTQSQSQGYFDSYSKLTTAQFTQKTANTDPAQTPLPGSDGGAYDYSNATTSVDEEYGISVGEKSAALDRAQLSNNFNVLAAAHAPNGQEQNLERTMTMTS